MRFSLVIDGTPVDLFNDESSKEYGINCFSFTRNDIVRSKILGYILDKIENTYTPPIKE